MPSSSAPSEGSAMPLDIDLSHSSPNHSPRHGRPITMLVLHATAGPYLSALAWLTSPASKVSAHYLFRKDGHCDQLVADDQAAWHAGRAAWHGETAINEVSLGIELENANNGRDPYPPAQYAALLDLASAKIAEYHISLDNVVRHLDIAVPKGRKTDPAGFPWAKFKADLLAAQAFDPLRTNTIPAFGGKAVHCGSGMAAYYRDEGGFDEFGYGQTDEAYDTDQMGRACTWLRLERAVMKYVEGEGVHLALLGEAKAKGWIG
jgi:N-acetyl-anhydromuramyl-L-alanine amidase AmpD